MTPKAATLHLLCGLPGTGKSTFARSLQLQTNAICFTPDDWYVRLFSRQSGLEEQTHNYMIIWELMWEIAEQLLSRKIDIILDFGFWFRRERDDFRERAKRLGASTNIYFIKCSPEAQKQRVRARNVHSDNTLVLSDEDLEIGWAHFEAPDPEEFAIVVNSED